MFHNLLSGFHNSVRALLVVTLIASCGQSAEEKQAAANRLLEEAEAADKAGRPADAERLAKQAFETQAEAEKLERDERSKERAAAPVLRPGEFVTEGAVTFRFTKVVRAPLEDMSNRSQPHLFICYEIENVSPNQIIPSSALECGRIVDEFGNEIPKVTFLFAPGESLGQKLPPGVIVTRKADTLGPQEKISDYVLSSCPTVESARSFTVEDCRIRTDNKGGRLGIKLAFTLADLEGPPIESVTENVAALIKALDDERSAWNATNVLARIAREKGTPEAVLGLLKASLSASTNFYGQELGEEVRTKILPGIPIDTALLVGALDHEDSSVRLGAVRRLGALSKKDGPIPGMEPAVPKLAEMASDGNPALRSAAIHVLGEIGGDAAKAAVPALLATLAGADENEKKAAIEALGKLRDERAVAPLARILREDRRSLWEPAAAALAAIGAPSVAGLARALEDDNATLRRIVVGALVKIGDASAVQPLLTCVTDKDDKVRGVAIGRFADLRESSAVPLLCERLASELKRDRRGSQEAGACVKALGQIGSEAALESLAAALRFNGDEIPRLALEAFVKIGDPSVPALIELLKVEKDKSPDWPGQSFECTRSLAVRGLGRLGASAGVAVPDLLGHLADKRPSVRKNVAVALGQIGDVSAVPALSEALAKDKEKAVRAAAATALGQIGDGSAMNALAEASENDREASVRTAAGDAIKRIEANAR